MDLTEIRPSDGGGVQLVATNLARAFVQLDLGVRFDVAKADVDAWAVRLGCPPGAINSVKVPGEQAGRVIWRSVKRLPRAQASLGHLRRVALSAKSRRLQKEFGSEGDVSLLPAHFLHSNSAKRVVMVHDIRDHDPEYLTARAGRGMDTRIQRVALAASLANLQQADALVMAWRHPYQRFHSLFPQYADKAFLVPFPPLIKGQFRSEPQPPTDKAHLLVPAHVAWDKNQELVLGALRYLPSAEVTFTGDASEPRISELKALSERLGVSSRVRWLGYVSDAEMEEQYRTCNLVVVPSRWEAASGPIFEAVSRGIPFVATDVEPIRSQIDQFGLVGPLVDPDTPEELAGAIEQVFAHYNEYVEAQYQPARHLREMTWQDTAIDYARVMRWVAGEANAPLDLRPRQGR